MRTSAGQPGETLRPKAPLPSPNASQEPEKGPDQLFY